MRTLATTLLLLAGGCTWVSPADFETRKNAVDDDGDGFAASKDCNDNDKAVNPDAAEVWYDGVDQDCAEDDDYDADADGWVPADYAGLQTTDVPGTGSLPSGDCDDTLAEVNPAQADTWRDGVDTDCGGDDDYDVDGDGYVRDEDSGLATAYVDGSGALPANDCDDDAPGVNPGASDTWRDGVDTDCGGEDDYDVDGDTYVPDDDVDLPTIYVDGSGALAGGDCDDDDASVNPASAEVWYDDIDNDCDELTDDDDQDADGYLAEGAGGEDCDDTRDDVSPGAVEVLSDTTDHDCDGDEATFVLDSIAAATDDLTGLAWSSPHDGVWSANSSLVYLSMASDRVDVTRPSSTGGSTTVEYYDSAIAFGWDLTTLEAGPTELVDWQRNAGADPVFTLTDGHDFIATDDALFGATGLMLPTGRALRMGGFNLATEQRFGISYRLNPTSGSFSDFSDISLAAESDGTLHAVGCESGSSWMQYMRASPSSLQSTDYDEATAWDEMAVPLCELHFYGADGRMYGRTAAGVEEWSFDVEGDPPVLVEESLLTGYTAIDLEVPRGGDSDWLVIADAAAQGIVFIEPDGSESTFSVGSAPRSVNVQFDPAHSGVGDPDLFVTYVDGGGDPWLLIGQPATGFESYSLPVDFTANQAVAWADPTGAYVLVAVLGGSDVAFGIAQR